MTIWIIGFLFAVGFVGMFSDDEPKGLWLTLLHYSLLVALWPLALGIEIRSMIKKEDGDT